MSTSGPSGSPAGADRPSILLVDDDEDIRTTTAEVLELEGHTIWTCSTGTEALIIARERQPDLIIVDLELPDTSGLSLAPRLAEACAHRARLVATSGCVVEADGPRLAAAGFERVLDKPFHVDEIIALVAEPAHRARPAR